MWWSWWSRFSNSFDAERVERMVSARGDPKFIEFNCDLLLKGCHRGLSNILFSRRLQAMIWYPNAFSKSSVYKYLMKKPKVAKVRGFDEALRHQLTFFWTYRLLFAQFDQYTCGRKGDVGNRQWMQTAMYVHNAP